jgi:hypothetical protein
MSIAICLLLLLGMVDQYGKHPFSTNVLTWHPQACKFLEMEQYQHTLPIIGTELWREQCSASRTGPKDLAIAFHAEKKM